MIWLRIQSTQSIALMLSTLKWQYLLTAVTLHIYFLSATHTIPWKLWKYFRRLSSSHNSCGRSNISSLIPPISVNFLPVLIQKYCSRTANRRQLPSTCSRAIMFHLKYVHVCLTLYVWLFICLTFALLTSEQIRQFLCFLVRASSYIPISRLTDVTCDRFLLSFYMCITLHVSSVKRSSSGVPHHTFSLQFLCLCLSAALSCKKLSFTYR
jgi:hypothetical protein